MAIKNRLTVTAFLMFFLVMGMVQTAQAYTFAIDSFSVTKNGSLLFTDPFNNNNPPPSAPNFTNGTPASYFVDGTMGPENSGNPGKLTLDSSGAVPLTVPTGDLFIHQRAILLTNIDPTNLTLGLKSNDTFSVTGVFDLIIPSKLREGYDVMFNDGTPTHTPDDIAMMRVIRTQTNLLMVQLAHLDFVAGTVTVIDQIPLDTAHEQIALTLTRADTSTDAITGSFYYIDGGIAGLTLAFGNTMDIFHGENFTRAEFEAFTPVEVPEPGTMLLLGSGLIGLWGARRKFKK